MTRKDGARGVDVEGARHLKGGGWYQGMNDFGQFGVRPPSHSMTPASQYDNGMRRQRREREVRWSAKQPYRPAAPLRAVSVIGR
jgi:hypothetical protein